VIIAWLVAWAGVVFVFGDRIIDGVVEFVRAKVK
jgi:hypothetical protein